MSSSTHQPTFAVLVVDDEPLLLMDAMDLVEDAGYTAYGASNADEAIRVLRKHPDIRVLFTDVDMPGSMNGLRLAHAVRDGWPPVAIIVASGHVKITVDQLPTGGMFFPKPYAPLKILGAIDNFASQASI
jgi:CheY-like chemotaxis protein